MDLRELEQNLHDAANVLVLAPLTPAGTSAYLNLLEAVCPVNAHLTVVTYTQPPDLWLTDWNERQSSLPPVVSFIHGGPATSKTVHDDRANITSLQVSPRDPMDIISSVTPGLQDDEGRPVVVSVQTLTVLLEYVDFNTAFRYLHVLIHRIRGAGARGFYQMDPSIHEPETINTLSVLFDIVVRPETTDDDGTQWSIVSAMPNEDEPVPSSELAVGPMHPTDGQPESPSRLKAMLSSVVDALSPNDHDHEPDPELPASGADHSPSSNADNQGDGSSEMPSDGELLTDEERIERLLLQAGGRMSQADIVENTHWSSPSVSRKLSAMEDEGLITRVQVGRGNLVFLDGHQPDISGSNTDDDETDAIR